MFKFVLRGNSFIYFQFHEHDTEYNKSFYWEVKTFRDMIKRNRPYEEVYIDGYHLCKRSWDHFNFFDMEFQTQPHGTIQVKYQTFNMPRQFLAIVYRYLRLKMRANEKAPRAYEGADPADAVVDISKADYERFMTRYGQRTGKVKVTVQPEIMEHLRRDIATDMISHMPRRDRNRNILVDLVKNWRNMAKNSTYSFREVAEFKIWKDSDGYYVSSFTPEGKRIMNGGLINHGTEEKPDWSSHT